MPGVGQAISLLGFSELIDGLKADHLLDEPLKELLTKAALIVEAETKKATPVDTGRLRASWHRSIAPGTRPMWSKVESNVYYASFVEYGTQKMAARHVVGGSRVYGKGMMAYAIEKTKGQIARLVADVANRIGR